MNYVKVTATSPHLNIKLFVPEKEIGKKLKEVQELHNQFPKSGEDSYRKVGGIYTWADNNFLSVTMRRVIIDPKKHRYIKDKLSELAHVPTLRQIQIAA